MSNLSRRVLGSIKPLSVACSLSISVILASLRLVIPYCLFRLKRHLRERAREREWGVHGGGSMTRVEREEGAERQSAQEGERCMALHGEREGGLQRSEWCSSAQDHICVREKDSPHLDRASHTQSSACVCVKEIR